MELHPTTVSCCDDICEQFTTRSNTIATLTHIFQAKISLHHINVIQYWLRRIHVYMIHVSLKWRSMSKIMQLVTKTSAIRQFQCYLKLTFRNNYNRDPSIGLQCISYYLSATVNFSVYSGGNGGHCIVLIAQANAHITLLCAELF